MRGSISGLGPVRAILTQENDKAWSRVVAAATLCLAVALWAAPAGAQVVGTWNYNGSDVWSNAARWDGGLPTAPGDTASITLNSTTNITVTLDGEVASRTVGILNIGDTSGGSFMNLLASGGGTLTFDDLGSAAQINSPVHRGDTINLPILLNDDLEIRNGGNREDLRIRGTITANSPGTKTLSNLGAHGRVTLASDIADGGGGSIAVVQNSSDSPLFLYGANSYSGETAVTTGVLQIQSDTALGSTDAGTTVADGATLQMMGCKVGAEALTISGSGVSSNGALQSTVADAYAGQITLAGASRINSDGSLMLDVASGDGITGEYDLTFGGSGSIHVADPIIIGAGTLTKDGTGKLTLAAVNTYSGLTTISGGELA